MDHHHEFATRPRHNIIIKPLLRRREDPELIQLPQSVAPELYPPFPPPHVVLHPEDANSKVFLAVARAFISVDNRAMTIKDIAERASRYGLVCQNITAAAQAVTTYLRAHKTRCDQQDDLPLLLSHTLSGTTADDDLVPALYSRSGGDSHPLSNRLTNFRKGTAVWYLSRATGIPCPFTKAGIRLCDYANLDSHDPHEKPSRRERRREEREQMCGQKRKRPLRGCAARPSESDNERPPKVKLTLRLKPLLIRVPSMASSSSRRLNEVPKEDSDSYDSGDDEDDMSVDSSDDESHTAQINKGEEEKPWSLPPYPRRSISIPCYTPVDTYYPTYPPPSSEYKDPFRRSPSVSLSVASPPPDSEDEADDFHVTMTRIKDYPERWSNEDETDLGWEADLDSEGDGETMWESPGPRSPSAPLIQPSDIAVKEEPRDVQGMLDAWEDFDSSIAETRVAEVIAKALDVGADAQKVKVEATDPWDWDTNSGVHDEWASEQSTDVKQEDFGVDSVFQLGSSSPLSPISSLSSQFSTFSYSDTSSPPHTHEDVDDDRNCSTVRPRSKTVPASSFFAPTFSLPPPVPRQSISSSSSSSASREPSVPSTALVTLLQTMTVATSTNDSSVLPSGSPTVSVPPPVPCVSPLQTRCSPSSSMRPPTERILVHTCQPCQPAITATQIEDISVYQMMLGAFQLLRRIDTDFVNLSPIVAYSGTAPVLNASAGSTSPAAAHSSLPASTSSSPSVITHATVVTKGSPEICGTWVPLGAAQVYVRDHLSGEGHRALEVFLSDTLVERFPSALLDFHKSNHSARGLNQFGRHFASTLVAGGLGVSDCAAVVVGGSESLKVMTTLGPGVNTVLPTPSFVLGLGHAEDRDVPLSATEQELFHELCIIPPDWDNKEPTAPIPAPDTEMAVDGQSIVLFEEQSMVVDTLPPTPTTARPLSTPHPAASPSKLSSHVKSSSVSSMSSLSSVDSDDSAPAVPPLPTKAMPAAPAPDVAPSVKDGRPLRRSKRVADAIAAHPPQPSRARSRKAGSRNSLS